MAWGHHHIYPMMAPEHGVSGVLTNNLWSVAVTWLCYIYIKYSTITQFILCIYLVHSFANSSQPDVHRELQTEDIMSWWDTEDWCPLPYPLFHSPLCGLHPTLPPVSGLLMQGYHNPTNGNQTNEKLQSSRWIQSANCWVEILLGV